MTIPGRVTIFVLMLGVVSFLMADQPPIKYPVSKKIDHVDDYHGTKVKDPYRWLEDMDSADTKQWVQAQVDVTNRYMAGIAFRDRLQKRLKEIWNYERFGMPKKIGEFYVFSKNDGLQDHSVLYIQKGLTGKAEVLLDPNTFSKDGSVGLKNMAFSQDHKYLAYAISRSGSDWREIFVMEVQSRKKLTDHIKWAKFTGISWYKDGFFYSGYTKPKENQKLKAELQFQRLYYHKLGTPQSQDKVIYQDLENSRRLFFAQVTEDETYLVIPIMTGSSSSNLLSYKKLADDMPITPLITKPLGRFDFIGETGGEFLVLTDYKAPNFRVIRIDPKNPDEKNWKEIIPGSKNKLDYASFVGGRLLVTYLKDATSVVSVFDLSGKKLTDVKLPGIGTSVGFYGKKADTEVFYSFSTFNVPPTIYRYNIKENQSVMFRKSRIKFNPDDFVTRQVFYHSKDKTRVPLFIVHKKGIELNGKNPTLLTGYGGFNSSRRPSFNSSRIAFLEQGGVYATACLRGGGEYGKEWHRAGMLENKQNVFDDFIAAAEYLIREKYTTPDFLAVLGGSNGGTLVGAVINQRPELFRVAIPAVGVMDMLRYHKFTIGWAWVKEYGSSEKPDQFKYLYAYSPLHNIKKGLNYPATLVTTADHDDRVFPAHSFKYIATLQEKYKGKNPVLIRIQTKSGHGNSNISVAINLNADMYSFIFYNMNVTPRY